MANDFRVTQGPAGMNQNEYLQSSAKQNNPQAVGELKNKPLLSFNAASNELSSLDDNKEPKVYYINVMPGPGTPKPLKEKFVELLKRIAPEFDNKKIEAAYKRFQMDQENAVYDADFNQLGPTNNFQLYMKANGHNVEIKLAH